MSNYRKKRLICERTAKFRKPQANARLVAKNTFILYVRMLVAMGIGLFTGRVLLKALGVNDYGYGNVAGAVIGMFTFIQGSLATASSRFLTVEMGKGTPGSIKRTFSTVLIVHFILAVLFVIILETVGLIVLENKLNIDPARIFACKWVYHCGVASVFLGVTQVPYGSVIIAHERMNAFAWMTIYDVVVKLAIALSLMYYSGDRLILNSTLWLIASATSIMIYRVYCIRNFSEARFRRVFDPKLLKPIFSFAGWQIASQTMWMLLGSGMTLLNQRYFGPSVVASIAIGGTVSGHVQGFIGNFKTASVPQIVKLYAAGDRENAKRLLIDMIHISVYLLLCLGGPICFYSQEALTIWLGNNVPFRANEYVIILLCGCFFYLFETSFYQILYAAARIKENAIMNILTGIFSWSVALILIRWTNNPLVTCFMLLVHHIIQGMIIKPYLMYRIANYDFKDFKEVFVPSIKALLMCCMIGYGVKTVLPTNVSWSIPACACIMLMNGISIYLFVANDRIKRNMRGVVSIIPYIGGNMVILANIIDTKVSCIKNCLRRN